MCNPVCLPPSQIDSMKTLMKIPSSLEPGDVGRSQELFLQQYIKQTAISFLTINSIAAIATATATLSMADKSIVQ